MKLILGPEDLMPTPHKNGVHYTRVSANNVTFEMFTLAVQVAICFIGSATFISSDSKKTQKIINAPNREKRCDS